MHDSSGARLVNETLSCSLSGDTKSNCDLVPRPAACPCDLDSLSKLGLIGSQRIGDSRYLTKIVCMVNANTRRVKLRGQLLESARSLVDFIICISHHDHSFLLKEPVEPRS